jgi:hypothetical protein
MGCDWSVLSHSNLSAPAAALSLSVCLSLCLSLACLRCKLPAAAAAALCARCRSRVHIDTHTLLSVCAYTTTHTHTPPPPPSLPPRRKPVPRTVTAARRCYCCQAFLLTFSRCQVRRISGYRVAPPRPRKSDHLRPTTTNVNRLGSSSAVPRTTATSPTQHHRPSLPASKHRPAASKLAVARPSLRRLYASTLVAGLSPPRPPLIACRPLALRARLR